MFTKSYFEFTALEGIFNFVHSELDQKLDLMKPTVKTVLQKLVEEQSEENLSSFLDINRTLENFDSDILEVIKVIKNILEDDDDMNYMYLTRNFSLDNDSENLYEDHEEVEILLENYLQRFEELAKETKELEMLITSTEDWMKIRFDSQRNRLMRINLLFTLGTFSVGCATLISSAFGMNLFSGYENHPTIFYAICIAMGISSIGIYLAFYYLMRRRKLF